MDCVRLPDVQLIQLMREGGEPYFAALDELERRHSGPVRAFAVTATVRPSSADELAREAWESALRHHVNGTVIGSVRACALSSVLSTASVWSRSGRRVFLHPGLSAWFDANGPVMLGNTATAGFRRPSLVARAFAVLPCGSQTVLWHQAVEGDDAAETGRFAGAAPGDVAALAAHAHAELYGTHTEILRNGMSPECRRYYQLLLAYADAPSTRIAHDLGPHLQQCPLCSRAVGDLGRLRHDCGALLPWGGPEHAAQGASRQEAAAPAPGGARPGVTGGARPGGAGVPGHRRPSVPDAGGTAIVPQPAGQASDAPVPGPTAPGAADVPAPAGRHGAHRTGSSALTASPSPASPASPAASGRGRHAAPGPAAVGRPGGRGDLLMRSSAVAGVCAVAAALAFAGDFDEAGEPQSKKSPVPAPKPPSAPAASSPAPSPSSSEPTASPSPTKSETSRPAPPKPSPTRPSAPPAPADASLVWLFDKVDGSGVTPDSSDNGKNGTLFGATRPSPVEGGALAFDGEQFVAAKGPLVDTSGSFTVSARVKLDRTDVSQSVVSQDASESSGFLLQYDADETRWEMRMPEEDSDDEDEDADEAVSVFQPKAGEWTHLTGVYDDARDEVRLYVDGRLAGTEEREEDYDSQGSFAVGRGLLGREFYQGLEGTVDEVRAYGRAVSSAEARALARKSR